MPRIPGAANLNAVLMRLPALKVKKAGGWGDNMCNLSRKEASSLFAVLAKRQRKTLPETFIFTRSGFAFFFWPEEMQYRSSHISWTRSLLTGKKHGGWGEAVLWPPPPPGHSHPQGRHEVNASCEPLLWRSALHVPVPRALSEVPPARGCLACFSFIQGPDQFYLPIHLKVKCISLPSWAKERSRWIKEGGGQEWEVHF